MSSIVQNVVFDCADPYDLAQFWSQVTASPIDDQDKPGDPEVGVLLPNGVTLVFIRVPEPKTVKNRLHLCLRPDGPRQPELDRVLSLGATLVADRREPDGTGWVVLADPENNELCLLRSATP
jgi:predicted enzyme related to lactoylglutathione lyase